MTQTGNWGAAEKLARELEAKIEPEREKVETRHELRLWDAVETFLGDQKACGLGRETQKKYRSFLERQFLVCADSQKIRNSGCVDFLSIAVRFYPRPVISTSE